MIQIKGGNLPLATVIFSSRGDSRSGSRVDSTDQRRINPLELYKRGCKGELHKVVLGEFEGEVLLRS